MNILDLEMTEEQKEKIQTLITNHGEELVEKVYEYYCHIDDVIRMFEEGYEGDFYSEIVFAEILWEETMEIPEHLAPYIDYESVARDLFIDDFISFDIGPSTHVFRRI